MKTLSLLNSTRMNNVRDNSKTAANKLLQIAFLCPISNQGLHFKLKDKSQWLVVSEFTTTRCYCMSAQIFVCKNFHKKGELCVDCGKHQTKTIWCHKTLWKFSMWKWQRKASRVAGIVFDVIKLIDCRHCVELCLPKSTKRRFEIETCDDVPLIDWLNGAKPSSSSIFSEVFAAIKVFMRTLNWG